MLAQLHLVVRHLAVLAHIHIAVAGTNLLHESLVWHEHALHAAEVDSGTSEHAWANLLLRVLDGNLYRECVSALVDGRIYYSHCAVELLAFVSIESDIHVHALRQELVVVL